MRRLAFVLAVLFAAPALAQDGTPSSPTADAPAAPAASAPSAPSVLTVDLDRIISETAYGQAMASDLRARDAALQTENDAIAADLRSAELDLAARRAGMDPDAFRAEADAFDQRAETARAEQDAKLQALAEAVQTERGALLDAAVPILAQIVQDRGGAVLVERGAVILAVQGVDITDEAIARIDASLGRGPYDAP